MTLIDFISYLQFSVMLITAFFAIRTWVRIKGKKSKRIKEGGEVIIGVQVNHRMLDNISKTFAHKPDLLKNVVILDAEEIIGKKSFETKNDYKKMATEVRKVMAENKASHIHVCLSGPLALSFIIGQLTSIHLFSIDVYQLDNKDGKYYQLPTVTRDWIII